jgi:hypothetical protein
VKQAIDPDVDIIVIGMPEFKSSRLIGAVADGDIFTLMPFIKVA